MAYPHLIALPLLLGIAGAQQWGLHSACGSSGLQVELEFLLYIMSGDEGRGPIGTAEAEAYRAAHDLRELAFMLIVILVPTLIAGALALTWFCKSRKGGGGGLPSLRKGGGGKGAQANGLEKGWKPVTGADGSTYYYNKKTKETRWDPPCRRRRRAARRAAACPTACRPTAPPCRRPPARRPGPTRRRRRRARRRRRRCPRQPAARLGRIQQADGSSLLLQRRHRRRAGTAPAPAST